MTKKLTINLVSLGITPILMFSFIGVYLMNIMTSSVDYVGFTADSFITLLLGRWDFQHYYFGFRSILGFLTDVGNILPSSWSLMLYIFNEAISGVAEWTMQIPIVVGQQIQSITLLINSLDLNYTDGLTIQEVLIFMLNGILLVAYVVANALSFIIYIGANFLLGALFLSFLPLYMICYTIVPFIRLILGYYNVPLYDYGSYDIPTWAQILQEWANIFMAHLVIA